jgi:DNA replication and repair protein RecF
MQVRTLHVNAFRNHADSHLAFGSGITLLLGDNGQGKTNVLEAISYLSLSKSFYAASDAQVVMLGQTTLNIRGALADDAGRMSEVRITIDALSGEKIIVVNGSGLERHSALVGMFPAVILSPEQGGIIAGGPVERRKFLDLVLCQTSRSYLADILEYRKILRQRNKLLLDARLRGATPGEDFRPWTDELVRLGSRLIHKRGFFVHGLQATFSATYAMLAGADVQAAVRYIASGETDPLLPAEAIAEGLLCELDERAAEERRRGVTLVGPHRDDLSFTINALDAGRYASLGEQKTLLIALKLAEHDLVTERCGETPILLLDDVFAELDRHRAARVMERLQTGGQCIITATDESMIGEGKRERSEHRRILIERGTCCEATA